MIRRLLHRKATPDQRGVVLITVLIAALILTAIGLSLGEIAVKQLNRTHQATFTANAQLAAEAGIEESLSNLNTDDTFTGYTTEQGFFNNTTQGRGTYQTAITSGTSANERVITSTGRVYIGSSTTPTSTRIVKVTVVGTASPGYSVQTGPGGLILGGSANISNSTVYVNGSITMNGSSSIGSSLNPLSVNVANDHCPSGSNPGPTYPQVCSDGTQPISLSPSTHIYGTVCATGQTTTGPSNNIQPGTGGQGLKAGCIAPLVSTPTYDRAAQIAAVTITSGSTSSPYACSGNKSITWPANLKLTGDVTVANSCTLTIAGNVYITGSLSVGGNATIKVADSTGTTRPVVMVDGTIDIGGSGSLLANSSGTGAEFISFKSAAACSPDCTSVTGTDLYNSQQLQTISLGGSGDSAGMVFDAYWSEITVDGSGILGSAIGQTVNLDGAGTVVFGTSLSSGTQTWTIRSYQRGFQ